MQITVAHDFLPKQRSLRASQVMDHFGIGFETGRHVIADGFDLPVRDGDVVCFTGASGSGKSSLMRAVAKQLSGVLNVDDLTLPDRILVEAIDLPVEESLPLLSSCGLGEAHLLLRTLAELSDGQRYRFRIALAVSRKPRWIVADEFSATLDRTLANVIAFNVRRIADRTGIGFLLATTHEDIIPDLAPSLHVQCRLDGDIAWTRHDGKKKRTLRLLGELDITAATKTDWPYFARWHYRSHHIGFTKFLTLLWHGDEPIGICVFCSPPLSLRQRNRFFGLHGKRSRTKIRAMNSQLVILSRVVLHPTYRGAGVAAKFIRRSCERCPWPWIETLAQMGNVNPFFEKAGFVRVGITKSKTQSRAGHSAIYGGRRKRHGKKTLITKETNEKSRYAQPVYYVFDNRENVRRNQTG